MSWNCCGGFAAKRDRFMELAPDMAVLCEVGRVNPWGGSAQASDICWQANGPSPKHAAVAGFDDACRPRSGLGATERACAGLEDERIGLLGIWSVPERPGPAYGQQVLTILEANADWIADGHVVVAGDFNIDAHGVGNGPRGAALFLRLVDALATLGLVSAYHAHTGEDFGSESAMTYFHRRKRDAGFHIDYCFIPGSWRERLLRVDVGAPEEWLGVSDHMPLTVSIA